MSLSWQDFTPHAQFIAIIKNMNLVETSALFKKVLFVTLTVLTLYVTFLISKGVLKKYFDRIFKGPDNPTTVFGKLPAPEFQYKATTNSDIQVILNTTNGRLPTDFPKQMPVFRLRQPLFSYEAGKNAQRTGELLGYSDDSFVSSTSDQVYRWLDNNFNGELKINTSTREIILNLPLYGKGEYYDSGRLATDTATEKARTFLINSGRFSDLYYSGNTVTYSGKFVGSELRPVDYDYETQIIRVDFFRRFKNYPILGPDPYKGLIHMWVGTPKDARYKQLIFPKVEAYQWEIVNKDEDQKATYPLIPVSTAWEQVSANKGVLAGIVGKNANPFDPYQPIRVDKILVNKIYLAYYDTPKLQKYMQPIYVFEGNYTTVGGGAGQVSLYYPAISGDFILPVEGESATTSNSK